MTNEHTSLEKYTSHTLFERFAKGLCVRGESETEQPATYWPQGPLTIAAILSHSDGLLNRESWGPKPSAVSWFLLLQTATRTPTNCLWHRVVGVASAPNSTRTHVKVISSTWCTCFLIDGWVEGQYVTLGQMTITSDSQQKKKTCQIVNFAEHKVKLKEKEKRDKHQDLAWELKKNYGTWKWW